MEELLNLALDGLASRKAVDNGEGSNKVKPIEEKPKKEEEVKHSDKLNNDNSSSNQQPLHEQQPPPVEQPREEDNDGQYDWEPPPWGWRPPGPYQRPYGGYRRPYYNNYSSYGGGRAYGYNRGRGGNFRYGW